MSASPRPGWIKPKDGVRFAARDASADRSMPLPSAGSAFYVFTSRALTRAQIDGARNYGFRYLGAVGRMAYAFLRERVVVGQAAYWTAQPNILGTNLAQAIDRLEADVLPYWQKHIPRRPLWVSFFPHATRAELLALIPNAGDGMRLPRRPSGELREDAMVKLDLSA